MASYKTIPLDEYNLQFRNLASDLFHQVPSRAGGKIEKGSYSFRASSHHSKETIAKIVIYQSHPHARMRGELPWYAEGVYVLIRRNGQIGTALLNDFVLNSSRFASYLVRRDHVGVAPDHEAHFMYFPVMAGEDLAEIASFILAVMDAANNVGRAEAALIAGRASAECGVPLTEGIEP